MSNIVFKDFTFKYDAQSKPTLKNINLEIKPGEKILIAGPSGSGKSTLGHCINGLIPFSYHGDTSGEVLVAGENLHKKSLHEISKHVGTILQDQDGQFVGLSVGEDVAFFYENHRVKQDEMFAGVHKALEAVGMQEFIDETPHNLSGGQKQSVSLAGILTTETDILLFDEPLANLDPLSAKHALDLINEIHDKGNNTIIIIEHRIEDVIRGGVDRVILMENGEIVDDTSPDMLLPKDEMVKIGLREPLYIEALKYMGAELKEEDKLSNIDNIVRYKELVNNWFSETKEIKKESGDTLLSIKDIDFRYYEDAPWVLKNVSFELRKGEILAILGNNGAGKSTLLKLIAGIEKPISGSFTLDGEDISSWSIKQRSNHIGYVMQNPNHMITKVDIFDEVAFGLRNSGVKEGIEEKVNRALKTCGLYRFRKWPVSALSYGQKKRVTIASILVMEPRVVILDEPTAGQDYRNYREFMKFVLKLRNEGYSIVIITHDMQLALEYADWAVVLSKGKVIMEDTVPEIMADKKIMKQANLRSTTLTKLSKLIEDEQESVFLQRYNDFVHYEERRLEKEGGEL